MTLDGIPENTALGVSLTDAGSVALLVAVFASNFPEVLAGAISMRDKGRSAPAAPGRWWACGRVRPSCWPWRCSPDDSRSPVPPETLALPLAFAGGAVLASVIDTLAPEAFGEGGPLIALASAAGFVTGYTLSL